MKFKNIPITDRPREKAWKNGIKILSNSELLAILLRTGTKTNSVLELSQKIINHFHGLENLANCSIFELIQIHGIGKTKAIELIAIFELVSRTNQIITSYKIAINNPYDVFNLLKYELINIKYEHFYVILLNNDNKIISKHLLYQGTSNSINIDPKDIYNIAIRYQSKKIICVHNHPGGNPYPSNPDLLATKNLIYIAKILHIEFIDHIIITNNYFYSILLKTKFNH